MDYSYTIRYADGWEVYCVSAADLKHKLATASYYRWGIIGVSRV